MAFIRSQNVSNEGFVYEGLAFIDDKHALQLNGVTVEAGDVLLNITGESVGRTCQVPTEILPARVSQHVAIVRPQADILDPRYLLYVLVSPAMQQHLHVLSTAGATRRALTKGMLERIEVPLPTALAQQSIAGLLGALDDKIELNRRIAATARDLAHAIFRLRYRSDDPDSPQEPLGEHLDVARGLSYTGAGLADEGMPLHNLDSIYEGGGYKRSGIKYYRGEYKDRHVIQAGEVLLANTEQGFQELLIACPALVSKHFGDTGLFSHHLYRVRPRGSSPLSRSFVYLMLLPGRLRTEVAGYSNGTTVNMLPIEALQKPLFAVPSRELVAEIEALVTPLFDRAEAAEDESGTLAQLRDTLLPKLVSGEVRLCDASPDDPDAATKASLASRPAN